MDARLRHYFDQQLELVMKQLPQMARDALTEVPLYVEDFPSQKLLQDFQLENRDELQGLFLGRSRLECNEDSFDALSEAIYLFREGILALASDEAGVLDELELREQIRVTLMHEIGHYYGLGEEDLRQRGYE